MNVRKEILDELLELHSPLAGMPRSMPFTVPQGYFEGLAGKVVTVINVAERQENTYAVPQGYFEALPGVLLAAAKAEDVAAIAAKGVPYEAPPGYFEGLPQGALNAAKHSDKRKGGTVIGWRQAIRWAAAAVVILGLSIGAYKLYDRPVDTEKALASLPEEAISAYIAQNVDDFETEIIVSSINSDKVIKGTNELSEQEIIQYLNEDGWNVKTEVN